MSKPTVPKPIGSLSLDLDNKWAYLRTHGLESWKAYPSYLREVSERCGDFFNRHAVKATVFVVGKDLEQQDNREAVADLAAAGHEIGNHSYWHYPWLDTLPADELESEVADSEAAIEALVGGRPIGFRAPGFSGSPLLLEILARRGYEYDASTFPTVIGPLAAWYARLKSFGKTEDDAKQKFATLRSGFGTLAPHVLQTPAGPIAEVPVTTMPLFRIPIHVTYLLYLRQFSASLASLYMRTAISLCRFRGVAPSLLLHPLDFLGGDEEPELAFFPGMQLPREAKIALVDELVEQLSAHYSLGTVADQARSACPSLTSDAALLVPAERELASHQ
ncbi:MAG: polysaccharide deacetylase family protein [Aeoliella sp.]